MSIFSGTEPPAWLENIAKPIDTNLTADVFATLIGGLTNAATTARDKNQTLPEGQKTSFWEELPKSFHDSAMRLRDPLWDLHVQQSQLNLGSQALQLQSQQNSIEMRKQQMAGMAEDQNVAADWLQQYPTLESRKNAPPPALKSDFGIKWYDGLKLADSRAENERAAAQDARLKQNELNTYLRDFAKIKDPNTRSAIRQLNPQSGQPSLAQRQAVADALGTQAQADARAKAETSYPTPTIVKEGNNTFLMYRNFAPKKLDNLTPLENEKIREAKKRFDKALTDGNMEAQAQASKDIEQLISTAEPAPATSKSKVSVLSVTPGSP